MASDDLALYESGYTKLAEFSSLAYPRSLLYLLTTTLGVQTRNTTWFRLRDSIRGLPQQSPHPSMRC